MSIKQLTFELLSMKTGAWIFKVFHTMFSVIFVFKLFYEFIKYKYPTTITFCDFFLTCIKSHIYRYSEKEKALCE